MSWVYKLKERALKQMGKLDAIVRHGDPTRYQAYFPRYLLKAFHDWFA